MTAAGLRRALGSPLEIGFSVALLAWAVGEAITLPTDYSMAMRLGFSVVAVLPLFFRNAAPIPVAAWSIVAIVINASFGFLSIESVTPLQGPAIAAYAVAARVEPRGRALLVAAALVPAMSAAMALEPRLPLHVRDVVAVLVMQSLATTAGLVVRARRGEADRAANRLARAGASGDRRVAAALEIERLRIAGELQAIVARDISEVRRLVSRARALVRSGDESAREVIRAIGRTAANALEDMQRSLGVLGEGEGRVGDGPPDDLRRAVAAAGSRGWILELAERGSDEATHPGPAIGAARIVEELFAGSPAAGSAAVSLRAEHADGRIRLRARGRGEAPVSLRESSKLAGLTERALLHGGTLRWWSRFGIWRLDVTLPDRPASAERSGRPVDLLIVAMALAAAFLDSTEMTGSAKAMCLVSGVVLVALPLFFRRSHPLTVALVLGGALFLRSAVEWVPPEMPWSVVLTLAVAPYAVAAYASTARRATVGGLFLVVAALAERSLPQEDFLSTDLPIVVCAVAISWMAGWYARGSSGLTAQLLAGEARLTLAQEERIGLVLAEERRRVASDLHDVVAHGVSLIGVLAGSAEATLKRDGRKTADTLAALDGAAAQTMVELRRLLETLRVSGADMMPPASLEDLPELVEAATSAGQEVRLTSDSDVLSVVPARVSVTAYRIVQEGLTNARKHAPGAPVSVRMTLEERALTVSIANDPGPAPPGNATGTGRGIVGMSERVRVLGGELAAGETSAGGYLVQTRLPLPEAGRDDLTASR
ncbi:MAG TPA: histidine kinase [Solirubrobacterales bacterium]|nr:histidine kinase [Solirubrobacterales bacterium]